MKDIRKFILEKHDWWTDEDEQLISKNDLIKFAKKALKQTKLDPEEMQSQLGQYKDPDDLDDAYEGERLDYCKFEDALADLLADDDKYGSKEGDICDRLWMHIWDFLDELR